MKTTKGGKETAEMTEKSMEIALEKLQASDAWNRPMETPGAELEVLESSMARLGQLEPVIVRPVGKDAYEIISGHRRLEAARKLQWRALKARVVEMGDDEARGWGFATNYTRKPAGLFWEAVEVQRRLAEGKPVAEVAGEFGRSEVWVRRRAALKLEACKRFAEAVLAKIGLPIEKVHGTNLEMLGEVPEEEWKWIGELPERWKEDLPSCLATQGWLLRQMSRLYTFCLGKAWAEARKSGSREEPACVDCPHFSQKLQVLFPEVEEWGWHKGSCAQKECIAWKQKVAVADAKKAIKADGWQGKVQTCSKVWPTYNNLSKCKRGNATVALVFEGDASGEWGYYRDIKELPKEREPGSGGAEEKDPAMTQTEKPWEKEQRIDQEFDRLLDELLAAECPGTVDGVALPGAVLEFAAAVVAEMRWQVKDGNLAFWEYLNIASVRREIHAWARLVRGAGADEALRKEILALEAEAEYEEEGDETTETNETDRTNGTTETTETGPVEEDGGDEDGPCNGGGDIPEGE